MTFQEQPETEQTAEQTLAQKVTVKRQFQKSVRIDQDIYDASALDGYIPLHSCLCMLNTMSRTILAQKNAAFTWTGPYGSGKSTLALLLAALACQNPKLKEKAWSYINNFQLDIAKVGTARVGSSILGHSLSTQEVNTENTSVLPSQAQSLSNNEAKNESSSQLSSQRGSFLNSQQPKTYNNAISELFSAHPWQSLCLIGSNQSLREVVTNTLCEQFNLSIEQNGFLALLENNENNDNFTNKTNEPTSSQSKHKKTKDKDFANSYEVAHSSSDLLNVFVQKLQKEDKYVIMLIDELGQFLQGAIKDRDIYFLQELAEAAARSNGHFICVGILHQSFDAYIANFDKQVREEWVKVQGRFENYALMPQVFESIDLIGRSLQKDSQDNYTQQLEQQQAEVVSRIVKTVFNKTPQFLSETISSFMRCLPLHPVCAVLLCALVRKTYGQNERSIFSFLTSFEPYSFTSFLSNEKASSCALYNADCLFDYINLNQNMLDSKDSHLFIEALENLYKIENFVDFSQNVQNAQNTQSVQSSQSSHSTETNYVVDKLTTVDLTNSSSAQTSSLKAQSAQEQIQKQDRTLMQSKYKQLASLMLTNASVRLFKVIILIEMLGKAYQVLPTRTLLELCFVQLQKELKQELSSLCHNSTELEECIFIIPSFEEVIAHLLKLKVIIYKGIEQSYNCFAGSDFDFEGEFDKALAKTSFDFSLLESLFADSQTIVAKRHYIQTGSLRYLEVKVACASQVINTAKQVVVKNDSFGAVVQTYVEEDNSLVETLQLLLEQSTEFKQVVFALEPHSEKIIHLCRSLQALKEIATNEQLEGDRVARKEINVRIQDCLRLLTESISDSLQRSIIVYQGQVLGFFALNSSVHTALPQSITAFLALSKESNNKAHAQHEQSQSSLQTKALPVCFSLTQLINAQSLKQAHQEHQAHQENQEYQKSALHISSSKLLQEFVQTCHEVYIPCDLVTLASDLADEAFYKCPQVLNELVNRNKISTSANAARRLLLKDMVENHRQANLGFTGFSAEANLFFTIFLATKLHRALAKEQVLEASDSIDSTEEQRSQNTSDKPFAIEQNAKSFNAEQFISDVLEHNQQKTQGAGAGVVFNNDYGFVLDEQSDPSFATFFADSLEFIAQRGEVSTQELFAFWQQPPYGVKDGLHLIYFVFLLLVKQNELACYLKNTFVTTIDYSFIEQLIVFTHDCKVKYVSQVQSNHEYLFGIAQALTKLHIPCNALKQARLSIKQHALANADANADANTNANINTEDRVNPSSSIPMLSPLALARDLVTFIFRLPELSRKTQKLSERTRKLRAYILAAHDPIDLLYVKLLSLYCPKLVKLKQVDANSTNSANSANSAVLQIQNATSQEIAQAMDLLYADLAELRVFYRSTLLKVQDLLFKSVQHDIDADIELLNQRARNIKDLSQDSRVELLSSKLTQYSLDDSSIEGVITACTDKPKQSWTDVDIKNTMNALPELALAFRKAEGFAALHQREQKRSFFSLITSNAEGQDVIETIELDEQAMHKVEHKAQEFKTQLTELSYNEALGLLAKLASMLKDEHEQIKEDKSLKEDKLLQEKQENKEGK